MVDLVKGVSSLGFSGIYLLCLNAIWVGILHGKAEYLAYWGIPLAFVLHQIISLVTVGTEAFELGLFTVVIGRILKAAALGIFTLYVRILYYGHKVRPPERKLIKNASEALDRFLTDIVQPRPFSVRDPAVFEWVSALPALGLALAGGRASVSGTDGDSESPSTHLAELLLVFPLAYETYRARHSLQAFYRATLVRLQKLSHGSGIEPLDTAQLHFAPMRELRRLLLVATVLEDLQALSRGQWARGDGFILRFLTITLKLSEHALLLYISLQTSKYFTSPGKSRQAISHLPLASAISFGTPAAAVISVCIVAVRLLGMSQVLGFLRARRLVIAVAAIIYISTLLPTSPHNAPRITKRRAPPVVQPDQSPAPPSVTIDSKRDPRPKPQAGAKGRTEIIGETGRPGHVGGTDVSSTSSVQPDTPSSIDIPGTPSGSAQAVLRPSASRLASGGKP